MMQADGERILSVVRQWNCAVFEADPVAGTIRVTHIATHGSVIDEQSIQL